MSKTKVTIKEIAELAQVSKSTVSRVLNRNAPVNEKKKQAVLKAMQRLDYKPNLVARSLAGGSSLTLGVVTQNIGSPFYDSVTQGVIRAMAGSSYSPIFADGQWKKDTERAVIRTLIDRNVDGLIMVGGTLSGGELDELCGDLPRVAVARNIANWKGHCIYIDNVAAAHQAVTYLIESGHQRIAHVTGLSDHPDSRDRLTGYRRALIDAGLSVRPGLIVDGDFSSRSGVLALEGLLTRNETFTAIFAANDEMAQGIRLALYRRGIRVPEDVSIVGFDDQPSSAFMTPPLTTIAQPAMEMGNAAARQVLAALEHRDYQPPELTGSLVIRESVQRIG